jgi:hypothetical protein
VQERWKILAADLGVWRNEEVNQAKKGKKKKKQ